jgi:ABC-type nitrate/sulfonate/bicarbonate transport system permease component
MRSYGASAAQRVRWVAVPAATPHLFAGLRIATMIALAVMTVAEMYASSSGIGYHVLYAQRQFDIVGMWAGVLLLAALGLAMSGVLTLAERRLLAWYRGAKAASR